MRSSPICQRAPLSSSRLTTSAAAGAWLPEPVYQIVKANPALTAQEVNVRCVIWSRPITSRPDRAASMLTSLALRKATIIAALAGLFALAPLAAARAENPDDWQRHGGGNGPGSGWHGGNQWHHGWGGNQGWQGGGHWQHGWGGN